MSQVTIPAICLVAGLLGLWQVFSGWRTGKMFAFDPAGTAARLQRSDGWLFTDVWNRDKNGPFTLRRSYRDFKRVSLIPREICD